MTETLNRRLRESLFRLASGVAPRAVNPVGYATPFSSDTC